MPAAPRWWATAALTIAAILGMPPNGHASALEVYGRLQPDDCHRLAAGGSGSQHHPDGRPQAAEHVVRLSRIAVGVRFTWPRTVTQWDTALLAVRSWRAEQDPYVEVSVGEFRIQQYFDTNAVGVRWLNLAGLREQPAGGTKVIIRTHAVTLEAETATLRLFDNHLDLQQRILVIAPHPDDAEIAAFGLYADGKVTGYFVA
jgi:hypothetical protein